MNTLGIGLQINFVFYYLIEDVKLYLKAITDKNIVSLNNYCHLRICNSLDIWWHF